jgi:hypothetical protein
MMQKNKIPSEQIPDMLYYFKRLMAHCATYVFLEKVDGGKSGTLGFI